MRTLLFTGAITLALVGPAGAQMCGAPQPGAAAQSGGMAGCMGMMQQSQAADDPMAETPANPPTMSGMMCPCCRNMAMMGGMHQGAEPKKTEPKHDMPMPKQ
jgi:hypothetical protein